ncbi:hypothetical protein B9G55_20410 [Saccharibacillus sp. O16]|nr:hypothetical protein B9G55_20410 [Saccharibacillus sp. O16]
MNNLKHSKKGFSVLLSALLLSLSFLSFHIPANRIPEAQDGIRQNTIFDIFVRYTDQTGERAALGVIHDLDYHIYWDMNMMSLRTDAEGLAKLSAHDSIASIEHSKEYNGLPQTSNLSGDPSSPTTPISSAAKIKQGQWGYNEVEAADAAQAGFTGKGVKIAILDTGVSEKSGLKISGGASTVAGVSSYEDDNGHGTFVAGIIGAKGKAYKGVAPDASLYAVKVMDKDGNGSTETLAQGLDWAIRQHMDIINLSLSFPQESPAIDDLLVKAKEQGITVIVAAGNNGTADGSGDTLAFPAKSPETITIAAVDSDLHRAAFSGTGSEVELAAPGVGIVSSSTSGKYKVGDGTSVAAPFVSGMVAVLKQADPTLTPDQVRSALRNSTTDLGTAGRDPQYGYGLISFDRLLDDLAK